MGRIKRYYSALSRYHMSNGHGIHSPFAYKFVLNVLRERYPYYIYNTLSEIRQSAIDEAKKHARHPRIISIKNAKLIFRVTNYFNPMHILQIGTSYGVSSASMLEVSSQSRLILCEPNIKEYTPTERILSKYGDRIELHDNIAQALVCYNEQKGEDKPFVIVNNIEEGEYDEVKDYLYTILQQEGLIVMRNLSKSDRMKKLWQAIKCYEEHGMTFSNEKLSIIVATKKLPRQDFFLWF